MITLPWPPSLNNAYPTVRGRRVRSKGYAEWFAEAMVTLCDQTIREDIMPSRALVSLRVLAIPPDNRRRDLDNILKAIGDLCAKWWGYDDSQVVEITATKQVPDSKGGRVLVQVAWRNPSQI